MMNIMLMSIYKDSNYVVRSSHGFSDCWLLGCIPAVLCHVFVLFCYGPTNGGSKVQ